MGGSASSRGSGPRQLLGEGNDGGGLGQLGPPLPLLLHLLLLLHFGDQDDLLKVHDTMSHWHQGGMI